MGRTGGRGIFTRIGLHVAGFILSAMLAGILEAFILGLTLYDLGLLIAILAVVIIFFFEMVYQHGVRTGRIPAGQTEARANALRVMMLPMVYLALAGLASPFVQPPGFDPSARLALFLGFPISTFAAVTWLFVRARRLRRVRLETVRRAPLRPI